MPEVGEIIRTPPFLETVARAWHHSQNHETAEALAAYRSVDALLPPGVSMAPELSVLRHNRGSTVGHIEAVAPTEDRVITFIIGDTSVQSPDTIAMVKPVLDVHRLAANIGRFVSVYNPGFHCDNIKEDLPHVQVMSTGRCGTVALYWLMHGSRLRPHHTFWWTLAPSSRWEMLYRLIAGRLDAMLIPNLWAATRAAEWIGAVNERRPMIDLNHLDTVFAPVFAAVHPKSRFVHLRRDPEAVFRSFYGKNQWQDIQIRPLLYAFSPEFRWHFTNDDIPRCIAWYLKLTETFAEAMAVALPGRVITISSDKLFAQDREETERLVEFTGAGLDLEAATAHFGRRFNEKAHKVTISESQMAEPLRQFRSAYNG